MKRVEIGRNGNSGLATSLGEDVLILLGHHLASAYIYITETWGIEE